MFFTFKVARLLRVETQTNAAAGHVTYRVSGQVFFASADVFVEAFDIEEATGMAVLIDVSQAHFWDITAVAALDKVVERFKAHGIAANVLGLNDASATLIGSLNGPMKLKEV